MGSPRALAECRSQAEADVAVVTVRSVSDLTHRRAGHSVGAAMRHLAALVSPALCLALAAPAGAQPFPDSIPLPDDFAPEGIATGAGTTFYAGSITLGDIYRGDLRTGEGAIFIDAPPGRSALGLKVDRRHGLLFVAGGVTGQAYVYDLRTGVPVASYQFGTPGASLVNDVIVTRDAAYFTDSFAPVLYVVPIGPGGELGSARRSPSAGRRRPSSLATLASRHRGDPRRQNADRRPQRPWRAVHRRPLDRGEHRDRRRRAHRGHARRPAPPRPRPVGRGELPRYAGTRQPQPDCPAARSRRRSRARSSACQPPRSPATGRGSPPSTRTSTWVSRRHSAPVRRPGPTSTSCWFVRADAAQATTATNAWLSIAIAFTRTRAVDRRGCLLPGARQPRLPPSDLHRLAKAVARVCGGCFEACCFDSGRR